MIKGDLLSKVRSKFPEWRVYMTISGQYNESSTLIQKADVMYRAETESELSPLCDQGVFYDNGYIATWVVLCRNSNIDRVWDILNSIT